MVQGLHQIVSSLAFPDKRFGPARAFRTRLPSLDRDPDFLVLLDLQREGKGRTQVDAHARIHSCRIGPVLAEGEARVVLPSGDLAEFHDATVPDDISV